MAHEICALQSLRTVGPLFGGSRGGIGTTASGSSRAEDCFSARQSWSTSNHADFGGGSSRGKGYERLRQTSIQARRRCVDHDRADRAERNNGRFCGALQVLEAAPEKSCGQQSFQPGGFALEKWLERYVTEIVRHLPEAPFLQYVPKHSDGCGERRRVSLELFQKPEIWQSVRHSLLESEPDGIILVHRLDQQSLAECAMNEDADGEASRSSSGSGSLQADSARTDLWGVLVQGRQTRLEACYILKTTQVASSVGILTYFCLSRAKCFGPSLRSQLRSTWLL